MAIKFVNVRGICVGKYEVHPKSAPEKTNRYCYITNGFSTVKLRVFGDDVPPVGTEGQFTIRVSYPDAGPYFDDSFKYSLESYATLISVPEV